MASSSLEIYQAFMIGYVRRINEATLNVTIGGVRIGHAKYSRLAQINLKTRIITFSRFAIENVPERCRRYLVIHELAHVKEACHNKRFWNIVGKYVPECRKVEMELQEAFQHNIRSAALKDLPAAAGVRGRLENPKVQSDIQLEPSHDFGIISGGFDLNDEPGEEGEGCFDCADDEFGTWSASDPGIVHGGAEINLTDI